MRNKLLFRILCAAMIVSVVFAACGCKKEKDLKGEEHLKIGLTPAVDAIPYIIARDKGIFNKFGLKVDMEVFKSAADRDAAFQSSNIDGVLCDMVAVCLYRNAGFDVKITGVTDGDFILLASKQSGIKNINEVKGHKVAISENTIIEYTLDKILSKNGIGINQVEKVPVPSIPIRLEMLQQNKVQLALLPEPFSSMAIKQGAIVLDSAYKNSIFSNVIAFKTATIKEKASVIKKMNEAYNDSVKYLKENSIEKYQNEVIKFIGYPEDMKGSIILPDYRKAGLPADSELKSTIEWGEREHLLNKKLKEKDLKEIIN